MRIHGRLSNPLLRRVQRHTRVSALFHATGREIAPDESRAAPSRVRPVQASLLPPEPVVAPFAAGTPLGEPAVLRPAPHAAPVQTFPAPAAGESSVWQSAPLSTASSRTQPASTPPVAASEANQGKAEEDRNWKRLQTIMRKHEEKQLAEQTGIESEPQPVTGQPQPTAEGETPPEHTLVPSAAPIQRRTNVVEELPAAAIAGQIAPLVVSEVPQQPVPAKPVPPLVEFGASGAAIPAASAGERQPSPSQAEPHLAEGKHRPEPAPVPPAAEPAQPVQRTMEPAKPLPAAEATSEALPLSMETERAQRKPAPQGLPEQPEAVTAPPGATQVETPTLLPRPEAGPSGPAAAEAPTLRIPRASLGLEQAPPVQPSELPRTFEQETPAVIAGPEIAAPTERPESQKLPGEPAVAILRPGASVVQRQTESNPEALERPGVQAPPVAPDRPAVHTLQGTPDRQRGESPPPLVKASLGGASAIQRVPESSTVPPQAAPVPRPVVPAAVEPLPSHFEPLLGAPNAPLPGASLEAVWPVQRFPDTAISPKPVPPDVPAAGEAPEVLPHNEHVGQILQSVASGLPSDSLVELVTPRKPRPASERKETLPVQRQESPEAPRPTVQTESATVIAPPPGETLLREAAPVRPDVKPVQTEIGPLPSDLWGLIGQPQPEAAQPSVPPAQVLPVRQSALQRHVTENEPVQRELARPAAPPATPQVPSPEERPSAEQPEEVDVPETGAYYEAVIYPSGTADAEGPANVVQRAVEISEITSEVEPPSSGGEQAGPGPNVEELAQRVYSEIRRRLSVEFERWRRSG